MGELTSDSYVVHVYEWKKLWGNCQIIGKMSVIFSSLARQSQQTSISRLSDPTEVQSET